MFEIVLGLATRRQSFWVADCVKQELESADRLRAEEENEFETKMRTADQVFFRLAGHPLRRCIAQPPSL